MKLAELNSSNDYILTMLCIHCRKENIGGIKKQRNYISSQIKTNVLKRDTSNQYSDLVLCMIAPTSLQQIKCFPLNQQNPELLQKKDNKYIVLHILCKL